MSYSDDENEKLEDLKKYISSRTFDKNQQFIKRDAIEENLKWNASLFFAKLINLANPRKQELSLEEFNHFKKDYEERNDKRIDTDALFQKYWLRNILGKIRIAGTASSACSRFSKITDFKNELKFLLEEFEEGKKKFPKKEFDQVRKKYEFRNNLTLHDKGLFEPQWLSLSDDHVDVSNIDIYFKPYLDNWEEFEFLSAYQGHLSNNQDGGLKIFKSELTQLHQSFAQFYTKTPTLEKLIDQRLFKADKNYYYLNFNNTKISYWSSLGGQITAFYWQLLIEDDNFSADKERIKRLIQQVLYWGSSSRFLTHSLDESKKRFLDAACDLIITEPDLEGANSEFEKVSKDGRFSDNMRLFNDYKKFEDYSLNTSDCFELFDSIDSWNKKSQSNWLYEQNSRNEISFLIKLIVAHDYETEREETEDEDSPTIHHYKRVFALLEESLTKPTLLWKIKCFVIMCRREFIPYLLKDHKYTSLAFQFIDKTSEYFLDEDRETHHKKLWVKSLELALFTIRSTVQNGNAQKVIYQIYRELNSNKYDIPYNRQPHAEKLSQKQKEDKETAVLSLIEDSSLQNHNINGGSSQFLLPKLFNELVKLFINLPSKPLYNNGTVSFPMLRWDGLAWLIKCSTYWKYKSQFEIAPPDINTLTNSFFKLYIDRVEVTEVKKYNFFEKKEEIGLPLWSEKIERLEYIEWVYPVYFLNKQGNLSRFLAPNFTFKSSTASDHHDWNRFVAEKLRTHIGVLLQVLRQLVLPIIPYGFEKDEIQEIKSRIEQQIVDYLKRHIKDVPEESRVDLFDYNKEKAFKNSEKEKLLPQVARALNWFSKKEQIIEAIIETQDIVKILTIAEWVTSEGVKQKLLEKIQQSDIKAFLDETRWIPEVQQTLLEISKYPQLINEINQVVEFWEKKVSKKNRDYEVQLYQTKMLLGYFQHDEQELNSIKEPDSPIHAVRVLSYRDHKQFYRALIRLEKNPESSHSIFKELSSQYPQYPVFALNQMAAKISMAKPSDDLKIHKEALEEWKAYSSQQKDLDEEALGSTFLANKLYILLKLGEYNELDGVFNGLEKPYKMLPDILDVKIESLIERKRIEEASMLLEDAENYHRFSGSESIGFIQNLKTKVNGTDNVKELHYQYNRIFNSTPTKLVRIFPEKLNGRIDLTEFVVNEVARAASNMLNKLNTLPEILKLKNTSKENRFNDLVQLALEARISSWGWSVKDQTRKAFSPSESDLGEIDLDIRDCNQDCFITCEAFILRDTARVKSHLEKLISHYTHERKAFLTLVYFQGKQSDFQKAWNAYYTNTLTAIQYPTGFEIGTNQVIDVTEEFRREQTGVRVGKAHHKEGVMIYHIFVNINYQINA